MPFWAKTNHEDHAVGKKKAVTKTRRKAADGVPAVGGAREKAAAKSSANGRAHRSIANKQLRKLAKKHRPPDEYFAGDVERPW